MHPHDLPLYCKTFLNFYSQSDHHNWKMIFILSNCTTQEYPCKEGQFDVVKLIQDFLYHFECLRCEWNDSF